MPWIASSQVQNTNLTKENKVELVKIIKQNEELKNLADNLYTDIDKCEKITDGLELTKEQLITLSKQYYKRIQDLEIENAKLLNESSKLANQYNEKLSEYNNKIANMENKLNKRFSLGINSSYGISINKLSVNNLGVKDLITSNYQIIGIGISYRIFRF